MINFIKKIIVKLRMLYRRALRMLKDVILIDERIYRKKCENNFIYSFRIKRDIFTRLELSLGRPYTSQNTWKKLTDYYMTLPNPRLLEYGSGFSTFFHLENLIKTGNGVLTSVEHDLGWFTKLRNSLQAMHLSNNENYRENTVIDVASKKIDWIFEVVTSKGKVKFIYFFRSSLGGITDDGTVEEFKDYVFTPADRFDVIVVDGRARKACIRRVLKEDLLSNRGLLVLFEAGRGNPNWPKKNQMTGTYDYKPEVEAMLKMGAEMVDGTGLENWDGWKRNRPKHGYFSDYEPMEACFLFKKKNEN